MLVIVNPTADYLDSQAKLLGLADDPGVVPLLAQLRSRFREDRESADAQLRARFDRARQDRARAEEDARRPVPRTTIVARAPSDAVMGAVVAAGDATIGRSGWGR